MTDRGPEQTQHRSGSPPLSPAESLALISQQRRTARRALDVDDALLYGTWGLAWLIAYSVSYAVYGLTDQPDRPEWLVNVIWPLAIGTALIVTARHVSRAMHGIRGSRVPGAMYGLGFGGSIAAAALSGAMLIPESVDRDSAYLYPAVAIVLAIAVFYIAQGATVGDRLQFGLGVWLLVADIGSLALGAELYNLGMALGGGGGFLVGAVLARRRDRRYDLAATP